MTINFNALILNKAIIFLVIVLLCISFAGAQINGRPGLKSAINNLYPDWSRNLTIYEVNIRQYTEDGTFKAFEKHLHRLKEMGIGILWIMPIHPIGEKNRKGALGSYYSVKDFFGVNPEQGTLEDFKSLVNKIHEMGMYVIIDWVANHCAWDNAIVTKHPDWFTRDENGNFVPPVADWTDVVDLNYDNRELRKYMIDALKYWVEDSGIDGYRCDVAEMVPFDFWKKAIDELNKIKPVFMLAEAGSPECHKNGFDATYSWEILHMMNDIAGKKKNAIDLSELLKHEMVLSSKGVYRMNFTSNHDENSWAGTVVERLGESSETFAVFSFMIPGMPLIYSGQEAGLNKRLSFFEKDPIEWKKHKLSSIYKTLIQLKKENKSLFSGNSEGGFEIIKTSNTNKILSFIRKRNNNIVFVILNLSSEKQAVTIDDFQDAGIYENVFSREIKSITNELTFELNPWDYQIFAK